MGTEVNVAEYIRSGRGKSVCDHSEKRKADVNYLYKEHYTPICCYLIAKFGVDLVEAEDAVNSAMLRYLELESSESVSNPRAYLYKISTHIIVDDKRHLNVRNRYTRSEAHHVEERSAAIGPERIQESSQRLSKLVQILREMPWKRRELLLMNRFDGLSYAEISRREGLAESTVREHIFKAVEECRLKLLDQASIKDDRL